MIPRSGELSPGPAHIHRFDVVEVPGHGAVREGDPVRVDGEQGVFVFRYATHNVQNDHLAATVGGPLGMYRQIRSFLPERLRPATPSEFKRAQESAARAWLRIEKAAKNA